MVGLVSGAFCVSSLCLLLVIAFVTFGRDFPAGFGQTSWWPKVDNVYNRTQALYLVEYASVAYVDEEQDIWAWNCSRCSGITRGFHTIDVVKDKSKNLQAYVGISESLQSIVVAFRGTRQRSIVNWVADLRFVQLNLNYPGVDKAVVHSGFYASYHNTSLRSRVVEAVTAVKLLRPELRVAVTGHSLGAAIACLCALDLTVNINIPNVDTVTFGQPRVGNKAFASFFNSKLPKAIRMTHGNDAVVHLPPLGAAGSIYSYYHTAHEVWIHNIQTCKFRRYEVEQVCDSSGEDPYCSLSVNGNSIFDHLQYLGVPLCFRVDATMHREFEASKEIEFVHSFN